MKRENKFASPLIYYFILFGILILLLWLFACSSNSTPPIATFGEVDLEVAAYQGASLSDSGATFSLMDGQLLIQEVRLAIDEVDVKANDENDEPDLFGPYVTQLITQGQTANLSFPQMIIPDLDSGVYDRIRYKLRPLETLEIPSDLEDDDVTLEYLVDHCIVIIGQFLESAENDLNGNNRQDEIPFRFATTRNVHIQVQSEGGFEIQAERQNFIFLAFPIDAWFSDALSALQDLSSEDLKEGTLVLDENSSESALAVADLIVDNIIGSGHLAPSQDESFEEETDIASDSVSIETPSENKSERDDKSNRGKDKDNNGKDKNDKSKDR